MVVGRVLLSASALVIYIAVPDVMAGAPASVRAALLVGGVLFAPLWLWFWWRAIDARNPVEAPAAVVAITVLWALLTALAPPGRDGLLLAALAAGAAFEVRLGIAAVVAIALLAGGLQLLHAGHSAAFATSASVNDLVVGALAIGGRQLLITNRELVRARDRIAELAISEERLRFARDLHDLIGQDLTLAVLNSELNANDLPAEPPELRERQAEMTAALRQALDDVRAAVAGYRALDLQTELDASRRMLAAAGIEARIDAQLDGVPPAYADALAWALREAVTNVVRHSQARTCTVRLNGSVLEVADDGLGGHAIGTGTGLRSIAERVEPLGGVTSAGAGPDGGFRLRVALPLS